MHLHVLGLGPVGCLLAHSLRRTLPFSNPITLIHHSLEKQQILRQLRSIRVEHTGAVTSAYGFQSEVFQKAVATSPHIDSLFVTLKAHHTIPAIKAFAPRLSQNSTIVLLQNGMGVYEEVVSRIFHDPDQRPHFILGSNTHGSFTTKPFHVVHAGVGSIDFGIVPGGSGRDFEAGFGHPNPEERRLRLSDITSDDSDPNFSKYRSLRDTVAALLLLEPLKTTWKTYADMQVILKRKVVVNAFVNPLTAILGCRNGTLLDLPWARNTLIQVCQEAHGAFAAQMKIETENWIKDLEEREVDTSNIIIPTFPRALTSQSLQEEAIRVTQLTKGNISSMLQDVQRGRQTEIEYINGYLASLGRDYHVRMPTNSILQDLVNMRSAVPLDRIM